MSQNSRAITVDQEIELVANAQTSNRLSHPVARGVVKLFNYYFRQKDSRGRVKRLPADEKDRRWKIYKRKIYTDYRRVVKGTYNSEKALVKRYSDPLNFLKYKLKRHIDLRVSDLSLADQEYYRELGGIDDINEMIRRQGNIDSIDKTVERSSKRQRLDVEGNYASTQADNHNHNRNPPSSNQSSFPVNSNTEPATLSFPTSPVISSVNYPPAIQPATTQPPKMELSAVDNALIELNQSLTDIEQEQIEKKRALARVLSIEKTTSCIQAYKEQFITKPELLGIFPTVSLQDQLTAGFDLWMNEHKIKVLQKVENVNLFIQQLCSLRNDNNDGNWIAFLQQWKLVRMFFNDDFQQTWGFMVRELNIPQIRSEAEEDEEKKEAE